VARLPIEDGEDFAAWLLADYAFEGATVMLAPAQGFYATPGLGREEVRIAYVLRKEDLEASVRILGHAIPTYQALQVARLAGARTRA
jgi:aspartate aminotransferase